MLQIIIGLCLIALTIKFLHSIYLRDKVIQKIGNINLDLIETLKHPLSANLIDDFYNENIKETYMCNLLLSRQYSDSEAEVYDFSKYEDYKLIMLTSLSPMHPQEEDPPLAIIPDAQVHLLKDGSYLWDVRDI